MSDLVERLRYWGGYTGLSPVKGTALGGYCLQAAGHITALEAQLAAADRLAEAADRASDDLEEWLRVAKNEAFDEMVTIIVQDELDAAYDAYRALRGGGK